MSRPLAIFCLIASFAAVAGSGVRLFDAVTRGPLPVEAQPPVSPSAFPPQMAGQSPASLAFLPIFGALPVAAPSALVEASIAPTAPTFDHVLTGIIVSGDMRWAVLTGPSGDIVVREGDAAGPQARIARIMTDRVEVTLDNTTLALRFQDNPTPRAVTLPASLPPALATGTPGPRSDQPVFQMVGSFAMSREEVFALVQKAEALQQGPAAQ